ncbi:MAG: hypothetical protein PHP37_02860 [Patescibacteria group bacterium]|nr:hypothetical protein [Patescibacteria group bacterium]
MKIKNKKKAQDLLFKKHKIDNNSLEDVSEYIEVNSSDDVSQKIPVKNSRLSSDEIEDNLMEIYSDDGSLPDFKTIKIKKKRGFFLSLIYFLLVIGLISLAVYFVFNYFKNNKDASSVLELNIVAPEKVVLGEDFFYEIEYKNISNYNLNNVKIEINYPENFILSEIYSIDPFSENKIWHLDNLAARIGGKIKIRGKIINQEGLNNLLSIKTSYNINGISSDFSKENFNSVTVSSLPFQFSEDYFSTVLVGEEYPLKININDFPVDKMKEFIINFSGSELISLVDNNKLENSATSSGILIEKIDNNNYKIKLEEEGDLSLNFKYKVASKLNEQEPLIWKLKYLDENNKEFIFLEKQLLLEVIKSDLHLNISINDQSSDFPVNFGERLNYVIKYSNKGDKNMKDLVIMAVLDSDFLNWNSVDDLNKGKISRQTISWTFREVPELKELAPGQSGEIDFSIAVSDFKKFDVGEKLEIKSYAQFSVGNIEDFGDDSERLTDNRSNIILNNLNSNLTIKESVLYFDEDNIPVGSGPLPPVVGEKTTFRYYWSIKNSLHELNDVKIELSLPSYVIWDDNFNISAGNLRFDNNENKVVWLINRWPVGIDEITAEFNVGIIPTSAEYNKIIILSSGSDLSAKDIETGAIIIKKTDVKTSKLEDDVIAGFSNDGRVR